MAEAVRSPSSRSAGAARSAILLPDAVGEFARCGYRVLVEAEAGIAAGFPDQA